MAGISAIYVQFLLELLPPPFVGIFSSHLRHSRSVIYYTPCFKHFTASRSYATNSPSLSFHQTSPSVCCCCCSWSCPYFALKVENRNGVWAYETQNPTPEPQTGWDSNYNDFRNVIFLYGSIARWLSLSNHGFTHLRLFGCGDGDAYSVGSGKLTYAHRVAGSVISRNVVKW